MNLVPLQKVTVVLLVSSSYFSMPQFPCAGYRVYSACKLNLYLYIFQHRHHLSICTISFRAMPNSPLLHPSRVKSEKLNHPPYAVFSISTVVDIRSDQLENLGEKHPRIRF